MFGSQIIPPPPAPAPASNILKILLQPPYTIAKTSSNVGGDPTFVPHPRPVQEDLHRIPSSRGILSSTHLISNPGKEA
ncbi:hypothetical protein TIFTF001_012204 [Ficus carica]|uniref:Uncharacterized protein n=1 Tax=Ficus carica TaxID=3494 RepID=A0AA87ZYL8_FICCA|nr:hypothetical protein TIFTF001_012204 [Ficus carica]